MLRQQAPPGRPFSTRTDAARLDRYPGSSPQQGPPSRFRLRARWSMAMAMAIGRAATVPLRRAMPDAVWAGCGPGPGCRAGARTQGLDGGDIPTAPSAVSGRRHISIMPPGVLVSRVRTHISDIVSGLPPCQILRRPSTAAASRRMRNAIYPICCIALPPRPLDLGLPALLHASDLATPRPPPRSKSMINAAITEYTASCRGRRRRYARTARACLR
ncbi:hypothetical protein C2E23DRAFT_215628 [Lenzites betulinus]|nr:hypothetical protein C2E23DRAFT_215628 [Lenzites betulinus]